MTSQPPLASEETIAAITENAKRLTDAACKNPDSEEYWAELAAAHAMLDCAHYLRTGEWQAP